MQRVLILGGTAWLGREIARSGVARGADVTCLARDESGEAADGARLVRADRRAPGAFDELTGEWDEVVELAYELELVEPARDNSAFRRAGGAPRPLLETADRALADEVARGLDRSRRSGLRLDDEAEIIGSIRAGEAK